MPGLYSFVHSTYSSPSSLFWSDKIIQSVKEVQQGDPLGPLLFCFCIHHLGTLLHSELAFFYFDDGTLGGSVEDLIHDLGVVTQVVESSGLSLNTGKSEIIWANMELAASFTTTLPGAKPVSPFDAGLLGSLVDDVTSISSVLQEKTALLKRMDDSLENFTIHDAILLLEHSFVILKLLYNLRTSPCFLSPKLQEYDRLLQSIESGITNIRSLTLSGCKPPFQ